MNSRQQIISVAFLALAATGCDALESPPAAEVIAASASGNPGALQFSVTVQSPDTGCEQYADWWEVITDDGELLYRRILGHSHVNEQPFTRSGGPVPISADDVVVVRAHMNVGGYGAAAVRGTVDHGFDAIDLESGFALGLAEQLPLPEDCAF